MNSIYLFGGLGADERVFDYLVFPGYQAIFIKWIDPLPAESISAYAKRLATQIHSADPILLGLSFGGMMAVEVSKIMKVHKLILIASAKKRTELPFYFRLAKYLPLHKLVPAAWMKWPNAFSNWLFGADSKKDKEILAAILKETDPVFLKWAIGVIVNWQNAIVPSDLIHIHGTADRVLPLRYVKADHIIENGGHLMTLNMPARMNEVLKNVLLES